MAAVPLVTETFVLVLTSVTVSTIPDGALRWVGVVGGTFVLYLAWHTWRDARDAGGDDDEDDEKSEGAKTGRSLLTAAFLAVVSPNPWLFWLLVGSPIFLAESRKGWLSGAEFLGSFLALMVAVNAVVAWLGGHGRSRLSDTWRRRLLHGTAGILLIAGGLLIWRAAVGDYRRLVTGKDIENAVDSAIHH